MDKVKTGVPGLDDLIGGGIPSDSVVLLSGSPGTGKTVMSLQFLATGARKFGERGLYITFEEREEKVRDQALQFGWGFEELEKEGSLKIMSISRPSLGQIFDEINRAIEAFKPQRMVLDSITYLILAAHARTRIVDLEKTPVDEKIYPDSTSADAPAMGLDGIVIRKSMIDLVKLLEAKNVTTLLTSEVSKNSDWYSRDTMSEFACDGVILLKGTSIGAELQRTLEIVKMRNTRIRGGVYTFEFGRHGISVNVR